MYPSAKVVVNGEEMGGSNYGYNRFRVNLTNLEYGKKNEIQVLVDDEKHPNSRWYGGAGIYRPVWLVAVSKEHIVVDGVRITTKSINPAIIEISCEIGVSNPDNCTIIQEIYYGQEKVAEGQGLNCEIVMEKAKLWSACNPNLYECRTILKVQEDVLDEQRTTFGIRTISWSNQGFFINGELVKLKGGCIHHDHGILGARTYDRSEWRRIKKLKEFGFNAVRSSHNPLSRAALEACDALGMYVMEESFDTWTKTKSPYDHGNHFLDNYEADFKLMVEKDYNHPSVIMYSIGNEVTEPARSEGVELGGQLVDCLKKYDDTRPVTAGINLTVLLLASMDNNPLEGGGDALSGNNMDSTAYNKMIMEMGKHMNMAAVTEPADQLATAILDKLDICGYNYATSRYENEPNIHPERIIVGSETYPIELAETWEIVEKNPHVIGDFMWTAWDYLGEVGIGSWTYVQGEGGFEKNYP